MRLSFFSSCIPPRKNIDTTPYRFSIKSQPPNVNPYFFLSFRRIIPDYIIFFCRNENQFQGKQRNGKAGSSRTVFYRWSTRSRISWVRPWFQN